MSASQALVEKKRAAKAAAVLATKTELRSDISRVVGVEASGNAVHKLQKGGEMLSQGYHKLSLKGLDTQTEGEMKEKLNRFTNEMTSRLVEKSVNDAVAVRALRLLKGQEVVSVIATGDAAPPPPSLTETRNR